MKKLTLLLAAFFLTCLMAACGNDPVLEATQAAKSTTSSSTEATFPKNVDHVTNPTDDLSNTHTESAHKHKYTEYLMAPTCTHNGVIHHTCECGDQYDRSEIPATGHTWADWRITKEATEVAEGTSARTCSACGATEKKSIPIIVPEHKHSFNSVITNAGCLSSGSTTYRCACGDSYTADETPATGHKWGKWTTIKAPTDIAEGTSQRKCSVCGHAETKPIEKLPHVHSYKKTVVQKVSCNVTGITKYTCACGDTYTEKASAWEHNYGDWVVVKEATPDEKGVEEITCANCGKVLSRTFVYCADNDDADAIARLLIEYINQYRAEEGIAAAETMEKCMEYAKLRSEQMAAKGVAEHNTDDEHAAATQLQYGTYIDPALYGRPNEAPYYYVNASEAVGKDRGTTIESVAETLATGFRNSSEHWDYVGVRPYIAVGVTMDSDGYWYCCIVMGRVDLDENPNSIY